MSKTKTFLVPFYWDSHNPCNFFPTKAHCPARIIIKYTQAWVIVVYLYTWIDYYFKYHDIYMSLNRQEACTVFKVKQI